MNALVDRMRASIGDLGTTDFSYSRVSYTGEFRRIEELPRRSWDVEPYITDVQKILTEEFKTAKGSLELWKIQAAALAEIGICKGAFLPIGVGGGKSLISLLAPVILEAQRPVLFVPAKLRDQTLLDVIPKMREHWKLHSDLKVFSYTALSLAKNAKLLEDIQPDLIIFDEAHHVANSQSGRTRRLIRFFRKNPDTMCVAMSGTIAKRSLKDWAHIILWCLKNSAPVPMYWQELSDWADALDAVKDDDNIVGPGALTRFMTPEDSNVRQGYRRRLVETPGVIASGENEIGTSLEISGFEKIGLPESIAKTINRMRVNWETPNGDIIMQPVDLWRHIRELSLGFWYKWEVQPPQDWLDARAGWRSFVRETLKHNKRGLDTELQVWNECAKKDLPRSHPWVFWSEIKDCFKLETVAKWEDLFALEACKDWLLNGGICWVEQKAFGEELHRYTGLPYFGAGDNEILTTKAPAIIASIQAHAEGKNLQRYDRNLVTSPMTSGRAWEQLLGRTHRPGQEADTVTFEVFQHVQELRESFGQALQDAKYLEDMYENRQKLNYANLINMGV